MKNTNQFKFLAMKIFAKCLLLVIVNLSEIVFSIDIKPNLGLSLER